MQQNNQQLDLNQTDEIDLKKLLNSLLERKFFIFSFTAFITLLAIIYALRITPTYNAISSFISPSASSIININKLDFSKETKESIFSEFLTNISSRKLQTKVFLDGDYLTVFNPENNPIDDVNNFILAILESVELDPPNQLDLSFLNELPYSISMQGSDAESISMYLDDLVSTANNYTIEKIMDLIRQKIAIRLDEIAIERELLLTTAERDRLSEIERIKENDAQKIREINDQIDRARFKAKEDRFNEIVVLTDAAILARSLGVKENNFKLIGDETNSNLTIALGENNELPKWYFFGEKALLERVELLESRTSDDPFIPELVILKNQLNEVENNNLLKTLEARQNDSPFVAEIIELDIEKIKLVSSLIDLTNISSMQISQVAISEPIKSNKRMIVVLAFIGSFMMSIFLTLIMGALRPDEQAD
jgi:chain length determinant protein (polysaccharide antigen chain regulator)